MSDPRFKVFSSIREPEVFHAVQHRSEICKEDPYDVESIHEEPRILFQRYLNRATTPPGVDSGRILLLRGESGAGKTHLMRSFRNYVHSKKLGYFSYMQITSSTADYPKYILANLIDSLDTKYCEKEFETSGLVYLSNSLVEDSGLVPKEKIDLLHETKFETQKIADLVDEIAELIISDSRFSRIELGIIRALIYLQRSEPEFRNIVCRFLRCLRLREKESKFLGDMISMTDEFYPLIVIEQLGKIISSLNNGSLVLCFDQLEEMFIRNEAEDKFRRAISAICSIADAIPSSILVISCLEEFYTKMRNSITSSYLDRIEKDPEPVLLESRRNKEEIKLILAQRLKYFYESNDLDIELNGKISDELIYPFTEKHILPLVNLPTRKILEQFRAYQEKTIITGALPKPLTSSQDSIETNSDQSVDTNPGESESGQNKQITIEQKFNDFKAEFDQRIPNNENELAKLLTWGINACSDEIKTGHHFKAAYNGRMIKVDSEHEQLLLGICNKPSKGTGLLSQIKEVKEKSQSEKCIPVIVRSTEFTKSSTTKTARLLGEIVSQGGRRVVIENSEWRAILVILSFIKEFSQLDGFDEWKRTEQHLVSLLAFREILNLDKLKPLSGGETDSEKESLLDDEISLGRSASAGQTNLKINLDKLTRHAAFLGTTGSGKTTLALNIVEQLLTKDIPVILIDRKGDLCGYAERETWEQTPATSELKTRQKKLSEQIDVRLFTPGNIRGRGLTIPIISREMDQLSSFERRQEARYISQAIGGMMGYTTQSKKDLIPIIAKTVDVMAELKKEINLSKLADFIEEQDPVLINAVGGKIDKKKFLKLAEDLQILKLRTEHLLEAKEELSIEALLGKGECQQPGKTRLSIISTKFLTDNQEVQFWIAQLLLRVSRWGTKNPSNKLQAVLLFDEADLYLPAQSKPATKEPMENLLKRARSAGIGILLATQNPGDFDYKCRDNINTWLVGRVKEKNSLQKMRPMFNDFSNSEIEAALPGQTTGEFHLLAEQSVQKFQADCSLLKTEQLPEDQILELAKKTKLLKAKISKESDLKDKESNIKQELADKVKTKISKNNQTNSKKIIENTSPVIRKE